jgi:hypothetical protein
MPTTVSRPVIVVKAPAPASAKFNHPPASRAAPVKQ